MFWNIYSQNFDSMPLILTLLKNEFLPTGTLTNFAEEHLFLWMAISKLWINLQRKSRWFSNEPKIPHFIQQLTFAMVVSQFYHIVNDINQPYINPIHQSIQSRLIVSSKSHPLENLITQWSINLWKIDILIENFQIYQYCIINKLFLLLQAKTNEIS